MLSNCLYISSRCISSRCIVGRPHSQVFTWSIHIAVETHQSPHVDIVRMARVVSALYLQRERTLWWHSSVSGACRPCRPPARWLHEKWRRVEGQRHWTDTQQGSNPRLKGHTDSAPSLNDTTHISPNLRQTNTQGTCHNYTHTHNTRPTSIWILMS